MDRLSSQAKCPTITKNGDVWTYISTTTLLISTQKSDKDYMLRMIQQWKDKNV